MTLLITVASPEYSLAVSDQRITAAYLRRTRTIDERFNKHIYFGTEDYVGNVSYTGLAQWRIDGVRYRLYDLISDSIASIIESRPKLAELTSTFKTQEVEHLRLLLRRNADCPPCAPAPDVNTRLLRTRKQTYFTVFPASNTPECSAFLSRFLNWYKAPKRAIIAMFDHDVDKPVKSHFDIADAPDPCHQLLLFCQLSVFDSQAIGRALL